MNILASNLLAKREEKRYTQAYMAIHCGMSQPNYSDIERGKTNPSIAQLKKFADILEISMAELITERPVRKTDKVVSKYFSARSLSESDKDTYIKILEDRLRICLSKKDDIH